VALLFAAALPALGERGKQILSALEVIAQALFRMVDIITLLAPIGAFGAMAFTVGKFGIHSLRDLGELVMVFYLACAIFIFGVLGPVMHFYCKFSLWKFLGIIREELLIVLGTSSSESVLPRLIEKLEGMGCSTPIVGLVVPTGYSFNLVGSSIYFTMGALFITFATHTPITFPQTMELLGVLLITSKGAAGVTGSGFIILAATLSSMHLMPQANLDAGLALIFAVDRFLSTGRAITNMIGNGITTLIVARWENAFQPPETLLSIADVFEKKAA
jgi:aerobic C4-dicarboxylate transport protein